MSVFNNPNFVSFSGEPITGRMPTKTVVYGPEMTGPQQAGVAHAYKQFCDAVNTSVAKYVVQNRVLADGTKVRMISNWGNDTVMVWPVGGGVDALLPHGFVVISPKRKPFIYRRSWPDKKWVIDTIDVPQARLPIISDTVFLLGKSYITLSLTGDLVSRSVWDFARHSAVNLGVSELAPQTPIISRLPGERTRLTPAFFGYDNKITDDKGVVLVECPSVPISYTVNNNPKYMPVQTNLDGNITSLQEIRRAVISETADVYMYRIQRVNMWRTADGDGAVSVHAENSSTDIIAPPAENTIVVSGGIESIGESPTVELRITVVSTAGSFSGQFGGTYIDGVGWVGGERVTSGFYGYKESNIGLTWEDVEDGYTETQNDEVGLPVFFDTVVNGDETSPKLVQYEVALNYPVTKRWRSGTLRRLPTSNYGYPAWGSLRDTYGWWYGIQEYWMTRRNSEYTLSAKPYIETLFVNMPAGVRYFMFKGDVFGEVIGEFASHLEFKVRHMLMYQASDYITSALNLTTPLPSPNVRNLGSFNSMLTDCTEGAYPNALPTITSDVRPRNVANYEYASRYMLDHDEAARFWAWIEVKVVCSGAVWSEDATMYEGYMKNDADPEYRIEITFGSTWVDQNDATIAHTKILATLLGTKPPFEFKETIMRNIYYPNSIISDAFPTLIHMPPKVRPPAAAFTDLVNIAASQNTNKHFVSSYNVDEASRSKTGIEFSSVSSTGNVKLPGRLSTGMLYYREFSLGDFPDALWLLHELTIDAPVGNFYPIDGQAEMYAYFPEIPSMLQQKHTIELRDGAESTWYTDLPPDGSTPTVEGVELRRV